MTSKAIEKLEREELETEVAWEAANETTRQSLKTARQKQAKLKRLR